MKKAIGFVSTVVLLLCVMGWVRGEAFAATIVDEVVVEGLSGSIVPGVAEVPELSIEEETSAISEISWVDKDKTAVAAFQEGKLYYLQIILNAAPGCEFTDDLWVRGWGPYWGDAEVEVISKTEAKAWFFYSLEPGVGDIALTVTGLEVGAPVSGVQATLQPDAKVELTEVIVYDQFANKNATGNFRDGCKYCIYYMLTPKEGYSGEKVGTISVNGEALEGYSFSYDSIECEQMFSTCKPLGEIELISSGLEEGAPASGVTLQISENAHVTLEYIEVEDWDTGELVEGSFVHGKNYSVDYCLRIEDGYGTDDDTKITLNGKDTGWDEEECYIYIYDDFTTCDVLDVIELTMPEPEIGRKIADTWPVCVGTNYKIRLEYSGWGDLDGEEIPEDGVFQKGHAYCLTVDLVPAKGYAFSKNTEVRINDQVLYEYSPGHQIWMDLEYSFREKITQVALPALPEKLEKGDTLPQIGTPAGVHYTVESSWFWAVTDANTSNEFEENVTTVTKDGTYVLELKLLPEQGYEFAGYEIVTVGGKHYDVVATLEGMELYKPYAIGMKYIDRVDIFVTEPQAGAVPTMPTVASQNNYWIYEDAVAWGSGETDDFRKAETCERFEEGQYIYLAMDLVGYSGYVFSDDLEIYLNGKKIVSPWTMHIGYYDRIVIDLGKLRQYGSMGPGDLDGILGVDIDDAIYLLQHALMPDLFPVSQPVDFDKSGSVEVDDAIYLLQHVLMPGMFPLQ